MTLKRGPKTCVRKKSFFKLRSEKSTNFHKIIKKVKKYIGP